MPRRTLVILWSAVAASVFLLGGVVSSFRWALAGVRVADLVVLVLGGLALTGSLFVAGRIVLVASRPGRLARRR